MTLADRLRARLEFDVMEEAHSRYKWPDRIIWTEGARYQHSQLLPLLEAFVVAVEAIDNAVNMDNIKKVNPDHPFVKAFMAIEEMVK